MRGRALATAGLLIGSGLVTIWICSGWFFAEMDAEDANGRGGSILHWSTGTMLLGAVAFVAGLITLARVFRAEQED